jgi:hypothetical protein
MALRHCLATTTRPTPRPPRIRKVAAGAPLGGAATSRISGGGSGGRGARRPRPPAGPTREHRLGDFLQFQSSRIATSYYKPETSCDKLQHEDRKLRTRGLLIWSQTRYRCAIPPRTAGGGPSAVLLGSTSSSQAPTASSLPMLVHLLQSS